MLGFREVLDEGRDGGKRLEERALGEGREPQVGVTDSDEPRPDPGTEPDTHRRQGQVSRIFSKLHYTFGWTAEV